MKNQSDEESNQDRIFVSKFRVFQINDVYLLNNLPRLATYIQDHMSVPLPSITDGIKKNLPITETTQHYDPEIDKTVITTITTVIAVSGDFLAPSLLSSLDGGKGMVDVLHAIGVTHVSLGNHEDDVPTDALKQHIDSNKFTWVNTNLRGLDEALNVDTAECSLIEIGNENYSQKKRVAILGLLSDDPSLYRPGAFGDAVEESLESPKGAIERLMTSLQDADVVVPMTHLDMADDIQLAHDFAKETLFPVIIGGHDHDVFDQVHSNTRIIKVGSDAYNAAIIEYVWRQDGYIESQGKQPPEVSVKWIEAQNYEPHIGVKQLVDDRRRLLHELETARLFCISSALEKIPNNDGKFSTKRNRYQTTSASSVFCSIIRTGLNADCCIINAGGIRGDTEYDINGWFTFADLKTEFPFQDPVAVFSIPGHVLESAIRFSRLASQMNPPEENSGLLHSCDMIEYKDRAQDNDCDSFEDFLPQDSEEFLPENCIDEDEGNEKLIEYIGGQLFDRTKKYSVALPVAMLNGLDNNTPLLEWVKGSGLKFSEDAGKPVKLIFVETFAISFWIELGSFAELDIDGDGIITKDEIQQAIAKKFNLDCNSENDARYLKLLVDDTMSVADIDHSGNIDLHEFLAAKLTAKVKFRSKQKTNQRSIANPSMILHRMASDELGFDARQSTLNRTIDSVKNIVRERDHNDCDEKDWHSNLSNPNLKLSSENQLI